MLPVDLPHPGSLGVVRIKFQRKSLVSRWHLNSLNKKKKRVRQGRKAPCRRGEGSGGGDMIDFPGGKSSSGYFLAAVPGTWLETWSLK